MCGGIITIVALLAMLVLNIITLCQKDAWDLESLKVGWDENMEAIQAIYAMDDYKTSQRDAIDATLAQIGLFDDVDNEDNADNENTDENVSEWSDDIKTVIEDIIASSPVHGNKDARFTILEYSELLCPYCQRQSANGTIDSVIENFNGEVNSVFRHYIVHGESAKVLAEAAECVAELNSDLYYDVLKQAFAARAEWGLQDVDAFIELAANAGVDRDAMKACTDERRYSDAVSDMASQGAKLFGISWTPGNVIIDRETGKYTVIPGAYPADTFIEQINSMK